MDANTMIDDTDSMLLADEEAVRRVRGQWLVRVGYDSTQVRLATGRMIGEGGQRCMELEGNGERWRWYLPVTVRIVDPQILR